MKRKLTLALTVTAFGVVHAGSADAGITWSWEQDTNLTNAGAGCAHEIAVGPNDVPWVVGCSPTSAADKWIFYLKPTQNCSNGFCFQGHAWTYANTNATEISIDDVGAAFAVPSNGHVMTALFQNSGGISMPTGSWVDLTTTAYSTAPALGGFVTDVVDRWSGPISALAFETPEATTGFVSYLDLWANGSGSPTTCRGIYRYDLNMGATQWSSPQAGSCGTKLAIFTENNNPSTQTPWSLTQVGDLFAYNFSSGAFEWRPGKAIDLTDHYAVGTDNNVYQWNDSTQNWDPFLGWSPAGKPIVRVAHAPSVTTTSGATFGPSHLWAVDSAGNIWFASPTTTPQ